MLSGKDLQVVVDYLFFNFFGVKINRGKNLNCENLFANADKFKPHNEIVK